MMAERWRDIDDEIESAKRHFNAAIRILDRAPADVATTEGYDAAMAFQHAMLAGYTSFETAIKRILAFIGEELPIGPEWHATLLRRISKPLPGRRPGLIGPRLFKAALELMRFRHVAMHNYDEFEFERAAFTIRSVEVFLALVDAEIAAFRAAIDPD